MEPILPIKSSEIAINKYLPVALLYFFFNSFLLPHGLLYTAILTPVFIYWLFTYSYIKKIWWFFLFTVPFLAIHFLNGVETNFYFTSYAILFTVFVFGLSFSLFLKKCTTLRSIFRYILIINFVFVCIACIAFFSASAREYFWSLSDISLGLQKFPRLRLLTYEPSYYALLMVPIAMYYYLKMLSGQLPDGNVIAVFITVPLLLAFSMGILIALPLSIALLILFHFRTFVAKKRIRQIIQLTLLAIVVTIVLLLLVYPDNPLFVRINNLFTGNDSSFRGRAIESYFLSWDVASRKSLLFGVGPGQVKVLGLELWQKFYNPEYTMEQVAIPCAVAETLAVYGLVGVFLRLGVEIYFFFKTRVYTNYYRFALFIFVFIYQFTGSYIYNIGEYVIWILAFSKVFEEFDKKNFLKRSRV